MNLGIVSLNTFYVVKNANHIGADLAVVASGDKAILSTKEYFVYRAGQSQQVMATLNFQGLGPNIEKRAGYFDDNNGMFFLYTDGGAAVVVRSDGTGSVVDTEIPPATWNIDTMDGTGPSGITVDWATTQILVLDFQALFVGRVRFYLDIDGILYPVHEQNHANVETIPYISTAKLPVRYEIEAVGSVSTNATMLADWKTALDAIALKQGTFNFVFHPHGWSANTQLVAFIEHAAAKYGKRVKFLNYRDAKIEEFHQD